MPASGRPESGTIATQLHIELESSEDLDPSDEYMCRFGWP
jgi:hypothetical protein